MQCEIVGWQYKPGCPEYIEFLRNIKFEVISIEAHVSYSYVA